ncbi:MAG: MFS transporter [Chloroflexi bacterium]|nr:MFS transporter [Chloroflexota bacterium]
MLRLEPWNRTLLAVAAAQFIALGGGNLVFPFLPFYVEDLGVSGEGKIALWTGVLTTATGSMLFIFSPIWGSLADRFGRKPLLLRAYIGAMFTMTLQGLAQNVWQMLALRALQGAFVGTIPAATALIATSVPKERMAYAMGVLQMALFTSQFIGPLVGGVLAASIGIRPTFIGASAFYLLAFLLVLIVVDEQFVRPSAKERGSFIENLRLVLRIRPLVILIGLIFFLHAGPAYIRPVIPLMVDSFDSTLSAVSLSGIAFSAMAVTSAIAALSAARLSGRLGYRNALALATLGAGAAYLPVAIAANVPTLLVLIGVVGLFSGAMLPTANALLEQAAPPGRQAATFGVAGSAMALAFAVGPLTGGAVAAGAGVPTSFVVIGAITLAVGVAVLALVQEPAKRSTDAVEDVARLGRC